MKSNGGRYLQRLADRVWATQETRFLKIIECALLKLRSAGSLPESEVDLNRLLYFHLLTASREICPESMVAPMAECTNQPDPDDEARSTRERKRPDFQWAYLDRYEPNPHLSSRQFVVECKRLGVAPRSDWILNCNYSINGIERFRDPNWAYGKRAWSGAMLGYWQSMGGVELLDDVNNICHARSIPPLLLVGRLAPRMVSKLEHTFVRPFRNSPYRLYHFWVDLRR